MTQMTKEEIAKQLEAGHAALTVLGQAAANGDERGRYQLYAEDGTEIASLAELAAAVRALA